MNTLLLVLFFGASVALAKSPFEHSTLDKFSDEERERLLRELADEENDPQYKPTVGFPFEVNPEHILGRSNSCIS